MENVFLTFYHLYFLKKAFWIIVHIFFLNTLKVSGLSHGRNPHAYNKNRKQNVTNVDKQI